MFNGSSWRRVLIGLVVSALGIMAHAATKAESSRTNVVLCMTDDRGWGDVGYNGNVVLKTPHLDAMATSGLRFDRFYAAQHNCSPTSASLRTDFAAGTVDIFPTISEVIGHVPEDPSRLDGISLLPLFMGGKPRRGQPLGFQASDTRNGKPVDAALLEGPWKLLRLGRAQRMGLLNTVGESIGPEEYLFNVQNGPKESRDLKAQEPAVFARMVAALSQWQASVARSAEEFPFVRPVVSPALLLGGKVRHLLLIEPLRTSHGRERWALENMANFDRRWDPSESALRGRELPEDDRSAGCGTPLRHRDGIITVAVKLGGAAAANVELDSFAEGAVARLIVRPDGGTLRVHG